MKFSTKNRLKNQPWTFYKTYLYILTDINSVHKWPLYKTAKVEQISKA